jgi:hypothetical protein
LLKTPQKFPSTFNTKTNFKNSHFESFEIVDEDVGQPEVVDELEVDGDHGLGGGHRVIELSKKSF